jgi:hypothetical protein
MQSITALSWLPCWKEQLAGRHSFLKSRTSVDPSWQSCVDLDLMAMPISGRDSSRTGLTTAMSCWVALCTHTVLRGLWPTSLHGAELASVPVCFSLPLLHKQKGGGCSRLGWGGLLVPFPVGVGKLIQKPSRPRNPEARGTGSGQRGQGDLTCHGHSPLGHTLPPTIRPWGLLVFLFSRIGIFPHGYSTV